mgnify:CR=1 FL=1
MVLLRRVRVLRYFHDRGTPTANPNGKNMQTNLSACWKRAPRAPMWDERHLKDKLINVTTLLFSLTAQWSIIVSIMFMARWHVCLCLRYFFIKLTVNAVYRRQLHRQKQLYNKWQITLIHYFSLPINTALTLGKHIYAQYTSHHAIPITRNLAVHNALICG